MFQSAASGTRLAIAVVIKGERQSKLRRYAALGVTEVWFWLDDRLEAYRLVDSSYEEIGQSQWVPELDLQHLAACVAIEQRQDALKFFRSF